jgi:NAD(P)-dependent dehydrogenase (short-subunit alcohol dehydrogenase family)
MCCGGDFIAFNIPVMADYGVNGMMKEMACCNTSRNADGFWFKSTTSEIAAGLGKRLDGKLAIVTGASAGLGKEMAKTFYECGATVVMATRNEAKTKLVMQWIEETAPKGKGKLVWVKLDLASLESTKECADAITKMSEPIAVLMNNAGFMAPPFSLTGDGYESQFQCNYLSHYYLTMLLVDKLKASPDGARVVNVSSVSAGWVPYPGGCCGGCCSVLCGFGAADFSGKGKWPAKSGSCCAYEPLGDYAYSKAAQVIFGAELDRRIFEGTKVMVLSAEPGMSLKTDLNAPGSGSECLRFISQPCSPIPFLFVCLGIVHDPNVLAASPLYAALSDKIQRGDYIRHNLIRPTRGPAGNPKHGPPLWDFSAKCVHDKLGLNVPYAKTPAVKAMHR